jgi:D-serine deaminase-like pyridoxal phosphate-dependent protein
MNEGPVAAARRHVVDAYGREIGVELAELTTPALLLDLPALRRNIERMRRALVTGPVTIRPHVKAHKSVDVARLQGLAGAAGFSVATVWEALALADAGLDDLFVVNTIADPLRETILARLARTNRVLVAVDGIAAADRLGASAHAEGSTIGVVIEVDTGMGRAGLGDPNAVAALATQLRDIRGISFEGVTGYEGHCSMEDDVSRRAELHSAAMQVLQESVSALQASGIPCPIVSAGGTRTWWMTAATPFITEIQAGTYAVMDAFHSGIEGGFEPAIFVLATVVSRQPGRFVLDAGSKAVADPELALLRDLPSTTVVRFDEEHGIFADFPGAPAVGERAAIIPGYAPSTVNDFEAYHVIEGTRVVDIWPIFPRSPGHDGLAWAT